MNKETIQVPEKGTYQWQLFDYWSDEFRHTHADHSAYIALNFAGVLDACRNKWHALIQHHSQHVCDPQRGKRQQDADDKNQEVVEHAQIIEK